MCQSSNPIEIMHFCQFYDDFGYLMIPALQAPVGFDGFSDKKIKIAKNSYFWSKLVLNVIICFEKHKTV